MPGVTGMQVYREVSDTHPDLAERFVFMTGGAFTPDTKTFVESTTLPVIDKPLDIESLLSLTLHRLSALEEER
jgi:hypothetical protein